MNRHHDITNLDNAVAYIILRVTRLLRLHIDRTLTELGADISPEQWFILFKLHNQAPLPQKALADPVLNDEPNITRLVRSLEERGYVSRGNDQQDRRQRLVSLTEKGRALMARMLPAIIPIRETIFAGINDEEIEQLVTTLHRLEENLS